MLKICTLKNKNYCWEKLKRTLEIEGHIMVIFRRHNTVQMSVPSKFVYRHNAILLDIAVGFFKKLKICFWNTYGNAKDLELAKQFWEEQSQTT